MLEIFEVVPDVMCARVYNGGESEEYRYPVGFRWRTAAIGTWVSFYTHGSRFRFRLRAATYWQRALLIS